LIASILEVSADVVHPSVETRPTVLDDDPLGLKLSDDTGKLKPED
jgi:hypothetical protein